MEVRIYLTTGKIARFKVGGEFGPQRVIGSINPLHVFTQPIWEFRSITERRIFNPECIELIAFITEIEVDWAPPPPIENVALVSQECYSQMAGFNNINEEAQSRIVPGLQVGGAAKVTLKSGNRLFLMHTVRDEAIYDQRVREEKLFTTRALPVQREGGGAALINTSNVAAWKFIQVGEAQATEEDVHFERIGEST